MWTWIKVAACLLLLILRSYLVKLAAKVMAGGLDRMTKAATWLATDPAVAKLAKKKAPTGTRAPGSFRGSTSRGSQRVDLWNDPTLTQQPTNGDAPERQQAN